MLTSDRTDIFYTEQGAGPWVVFTHAWALNSDQWLYFLTLVVAALLYWCAVNLVRSRTGRALIAIRDHPVAASAKFCGECGKPAGVQVAAIEPAGPPGAAAEPARPRTEVRVKPLKDWRLEDLRAEARNRGVDDSGTRQALLARLRQKVPQAA